MFWELYQNQLAMSDQQWNFPLLSVKEVRPSEVVFAPVTDQDLRKGCDLKPEIYVFH